MGQLRRNRQHTCALLISVVACLAVSAVAQPVPWQGRAQPAGTPAAQVSPDEATLTIWNRPIVTFRMTLAGRSPRARAAGAAQRLSELPTEVLARGVYAANFTWESYRGIVVSVGGVPVFRVFEGDLDPDSGETLEMVSERAAGRLREAVAAYLELREWKRLLRGALLAVLATILFAVAVWLIRRSRTWLTERLVAASTAPVERVSGFGIDLRQQTIRLANWLVRVLAWAIMLALGYVWLTSVLVQFPYSAPWGQALGTYVLGFLRMVGTAVLGAIPGFVTVVVIFLITRWVTGFLGDFFQAVEVGRIDVAWLAPEMARATRRIVAFLIWAFALTVAYPFIPGSESAAFKGVSVLLGVMLSLGSAGLVNQVMSGFVVVYSRAFRPGDYVHIGNVEGTVTEIGMLSTKVRAPSREEITIPNAVVVGATAVNFSRPTPDPQSSVAKIPVTVGYDVPWRQVHALLLAAAGHTVGLRREPAPYVVQRALSDFYVEYELVVWAETSAGRETALSTLRANIQDAFNDEGLQLMSPHFESQPDRPVVAPRSKWFGPPSTAEAPAAESPPHPQR